MLNKIYYIIFIINFYLLANPVPPNGYEFNQSQRQAFYIFHWAIINADTLNGEGDHWIGAFHTYDETTSMSMLDLMNNSKICICDYLSTPYNQMLLRNIPTIVLFNHSTYFLIDDKEDFYKDLIDVNIFHTNPSDAATFLKSIYYDINSWWGSEKVQTAVKKYINNNFGKENLLTNYINNLN